MEAHSIKALMQLVERAENVTDRIRALDMAAPDVRIPDVPLPLSLETTEAWLDLASECCRRPLLARSKQLLESNGIDPAAIPADVLDRPAQIADLLRVVDGLAEGLRSAAHQSLGRALTKSVEDAESVIRVFTAASRELDRLTGSAPWIVTLAAARCAETPHDAKAAVQIAKRVAEHAQAAARFGIEIPEFASLDEALGTLTGLNARIHEHEKLLTSEGLSANRDALTGLSVHDAADQLLQATVNLRSEKEKLVSEARSIVAQLRMVGFENSRTASTVADLRELVPQLRNLLEARRRAFQTSLGSTAFQIVESLLAGRLPAAEEVTDEELGNAIRKAVASGYRLELEAPREDR